MVCFMWSTIIQYRWGKFQALYFYITFSRWFYLKWLTIWWVHSVSIRARAIKSIKENFTCIAFKFRVFSCPIKVLLVLLKFFKGNTALLKACMIHRLKNAMPLLKAGWKASYDLHVWIQGWCTLSIDLCWNAFMLDSVINTNCQK